VDLSMWVVNYLVLMCDAHGYGEFGNCPTLGYIALCHYLLRWLSTSNLKVWAKKLCLLIEDNIDYFGCDYRMCYFNVQKVLPSRMLLLQGQNGQTWEDHVCNCAPSHLPNVDDQIDPFLDVVIVGLRCMLCG
jgi:hypothetical protein